MNIKITIILFIICFNYLSAQTYDKDWALLIKKIDEQKTISISELLSFEKKHQKLFINYPDNSTQFYSLLASKYYDQNEVEATGKNYASAFEYAKKANDTLLIYIAELNLAYYYQSQNYYIEAEKFYEACLYGISIVYGGANTKQYTEVYSNYITLLIDMQNYAKAKPGVDALIYYYKTLEGENTIRYLGLLNKKAIVMQNLGDYKSAIEILKNIVDEKKALQFGDTLAYLVGLSNLGDVYRQSGAYNLAIDNLKSAIMLHTNYKIKDRDILATIENNLGLCYKNTSQPKLAEQSYNTSLEIHNSINQTLTEPYCSTLSNKADLLRLLGRTGEASEILLKALEIRRKKYGEKTENYANALSNLANVYFDAGFYQESLKKNLEAKEIYLQTVGENHQSYGNCLNSLSLCYLYFKDYKKAEEYKLKALKIIELNVGKSHYRYSSYLISTFMLYKQTNQLQKAEINLKDALNLVEHSLGRKHELFAQAQLSMAELYCLENRFEEAAPLYFECLDYYAAQINDYFNAMSEEQQAEYLQFIVPVFESYNLYLINFKLNKPNKNFKEFIKRGLRYQLQIKSLLANRSAQLKKEIKNSNNIDLQKSYDDWLMVKNELLNNYKSIDVILENNDLYKKASDLEIQLKSKLKNFSNQSVNSFEEIKQNLNSSEAAIEIFKVNEMVNDSQINVKYGAYVIKNKLLEPEFIIYENGKNLEEEQFDNYFNCIDNQLKDTISYSAFIKPLENLLKGINQIYISSDGVFHKLNFLSLYNTKTNKYLVDDYEIYQIPNLSYISNNNHKDLNTNLTATLFGDPDYEYDFKKNKSKKEVESNLLVAKRFGLTKLTKLPGTRTEVEDIAKNLNAKNWTTKTFIEQYASEENLRNVNSPKILHIATHGFYLKDIESDDKLFLGFENSAIKDYSLLRSGIILAGVGPSTADSLNVQSENDGVFTAFEASLLNLTNTDLVVLSACQTGLGDDMGSQGIAGLQHSFTIAGAKNIIMSLWPVDDYATQFLMTVFYKNYALTQNVESSFKIAQLETKKKFTHPYYWGAFVLLKTFN